MGSPAFDTDVGAARRKNPRHRKTKDKAPQAPAEAETPQPATEDEAEPVRVRTEPPAGLTTEGRILRILRYDEEVSTEQALEALLEVIDELPEGSVAIMIIGRETRWANFTGERTPESEYPEILDEEQEPSNSRELAARVSIVLGKIELEKPKGEALARLLFETIIEPTKNRKDRRNALATAINLFMNERPELPTVPNEPMSEAEFKKIIFKYRRVLEELGVILKPRAFGTISAIGKAISMTIESIEDPSERAVILGAAVYKAIMSSSTVKPDDSFPRGVSGVSVKVVPIGHGMIPGFPDMHTDVLEMLGFGDNLEELLNRHVRRWHPIG